MAKKEAGDPTQPQPSLPVTKLGYGTILVRRSSGERVLSLGRGEIVIQGAGPSASPVVQMISERADVILRDSQGSKDTVHLDGDHARVTLATGDASIVIDAEKQEITVGQPGEAGIVLKSGAPVAALWIGTSDDNGSAKPGLVVLRNNRGGDSVVLDGSTGVISTQVLGKGLDEDRGGAFVLRNAFGTEIFRADYLTVDTVDSFEQHGQLRISNSAGAEAILLDGKNGDIQLNNADCAEDFDVLGAEAVEPGTVVVINNAEGKLEPSHEPYDKKVVGVISGAGNCKPGVILDKHHSQPGRLPVALVGKVYCRAEADAAEIEVGDLLTTSTLPGYAMKASDPMRAFGAVIGKALRPLKTGRGLIPILIALQ